MKINSFGSICSGTGFQEIAIKKVFPGVELKYFAEIDKHAIKSFKTIHGEIENLEDFTKFKNPGYVDFLFASTPCQDFSMIGSQKGFEGFKGSLTFEFIEFLKRMKKLPKVVGFENVMGLLSEKFINGYNVFKNELINLGYNVNEFFSLGYDSGIPQSRPRIFLICTLDNLIINKPYKKELKFTLKDLWEDKSNLVEVPAKRLKGMKNKKGIFRERFKTKSNLISNCLTTKPGFDSITNNFFNLDYTEKNLDEVNKIYAINSKGYWNLMGAEKEYNLVKNKLSENQLYKIAGNGIIVDVLVDLFEELKKSKLSEKSFKLKKNGDIQYCLF